MGSNCYCRVAPEVGDVTVNTRRVPPVWNVEPGATHTWILLAQPRPLSNPLAPSSWQEHGCHEEPVLGRSSCSRVCGLSQVAAAPGIKRCGRSTHTWGEVEIGPRVVPNHVPDTPRGVTPRGSSLNQRLAGTRGTLSGPCQTQKTRRKDVRESHRRQNAGAKGVVQLEKVILS